MRLEDAMVYALITHGYGMTPERLAEIINCDRLHIRADGNPVTDKQVYATACRNPSVFIKSGGRIHLLM